MNNIVINAQCINKFIKPLKELGEEFNFSLGESNNKVRIIKGEENIIKFDNDSYDIYYTEEVYIYRLFIHVVARFKTSHHFHYYFEFNPQIKNLTYMLDSSRNAVMKTNEVKRLIRYLAAMGYNSLMLYTEDTYVVKKYPYFGYLRNPYTKEDIKEIDEYAKMFGVELIPCIQTLAHFNSLIRHYSMTNLFDCNDILLIGEETTYEFLEELIKTCKENFSTNKIHIGMDEAWMVGRGKYLDKHGYHEKGELMNYHVKRILDICDKYGLKPMMWSDMYISLLDGGAMVSEEKLKEIPKNVELIYWDYYHTEPNHFIKNLMIHKRIGNKTGFAGGAWKWLGFTPDNRYSLIEIHANMTACKLTNTDNYILTGWGDNGAETSTYAILPALYFASIDRTEYLRLDQDIDHHIFKDEFMILSDGLTFNEFMKLDLNNRITHNDDFMEKNTANKYLLFNDPLLGTLDTIIDDKANSMYLEHLEEFKKVPYKGTKFAYLFDTQVNLCKVLSIKALLGVNLRKHYQEHDKESLTNDLKDCKEILVLLENFYTTFKYQWDKENRVNGFDVQDLRFGALEKRLKVTIDKLSKYLKGEVESIPELDEKLLCFMGHGDEFEKDYDQCEYRWRRMTSVNVND